MPGCVIRTAIPASDEESGFPLVSGSAATQCYPPHRRAKYFGGAMRIVFAVVTATGLMVSPLAWADPLAPGKPAGVHSAQFGRSETLVFGGIAALAVGIIVATSGGRSSPGNNPVAAVASTV